MNNKLKVVIILFCSGYYFAQTLDFLAKSGIIHIVSL